MVVSSNSGVGKGHIQHHGGGTYSVMEEISEMLSSHGVVNFAAMVAAVTPEAVEAMEAVLATIMNARWWLPG